MPSVIAVGDVYVALYVDDELEAGDGGKENVCR